MDVLESSEILYENPNVKTEYQEDLEFIKSYKDMAKLFDIDDIDESTLSPWVLRLTFDKESLMNRKITIQEIQEIIKEKSHNDQEIDCVFSDDSSKKMIMRIKLKSDGNANYLEFIKDFEKQLIEQTIRGVSGISNIFLSELNIIKYDETGDNSYKPVKEWILTTNGSNLLNILSEDAVDSVRTYSNDIYEFFELYGIDATRQLIYRELKKVYRESNPNPRHIRLIADVMTYRGKLMQIDRHGLNKNAEIGPISKASFEEVMNIFTKASLFAEKDNMKGVSANLMMGQFCKAGTNNFDVILDNDKLMEEIENALYRDTTEEFKTYDENDADKVFTETYGTKETFDNVTEDDFEFGFGFEKNKEHQLKSSMRSSVKVTGKTAAKIVVNEANLESVDINKPDYKNTAEETLDLDNIDIEEPDYKEVSPPTEISQEQKEATEEATEETLKKVEANAEPKGKRGRKPKAVTIEETVLEETPISESVEETLTEEAKPVEKEKKTIKKVVKKVVKK